MNPNLIIFFLVLSCVTAVIGKFLIGFLRKWQLGQTIREDGPRTHYAKTGTPTFGGIMFVSVIALTGIGLFITGNGNWDLVCLLTAVVMMALIGLIDDYIKVKINKEGLSVKQKTCLMLVVVALVATYVIFAHGDPVIYVFFPPYKLVVGGGWRILYWLFIVVYLYFCINAVNLTDGIDGLAGSITAAVMIALAIINFYLPALGMWSVYFSLAVAAGCTGFLWHNHYPAKVFMGDTGSLALGACASIIPLLMGVPWLFAFFGLIYVAEALSVVIQVAYFKYTHGKRIFLMSPIHHHFELKGWNEKRIVRTFLLITLIAILLGELLLQASFN